jgi:tRNA A37 threonylcarbamoyladenosine biosynthesis protein TsaE
MKILEFIQRMADELGFTPTDDQYLAMRVFGQFLADRSSDTVMIMRGSAGTGKTSLAGAMVRTLHRLGQKLTLMAPTGRAAKVFALSSGLPAFTIHRRIYREKAYQGLDGQFQLNNNLYHSMLFVVDEASMVSKGGEGEGAFGSGSLLDDLIHYVYSGTNCRLLLIGDSAQLPPVGEEESPALSADVLAGYGLKVYQTDLCQVVRQDVESGILWNATALRRLITHDEATSLPVIRFSGFADIVRLPGNELIEQLATSYSRVGMDQTIVITRSNKRANIYNQGIRNTVLDREEALCGGDMLMVVRNNYFWTEREQRENPDQTLPLSFLANGDVARVERVRNIRELYGFRFADVWMQFPDYDDYEMQLTVIMDSLTTDAPALTREQNEQLYQQVMEDYQDVPLKADRLKALRQDALFNAVQVKFAYAVTCHKAQGGQWEHVYLDQGYMTDDMITPDYIHWLYTAFTRATSCLFLVNWPKNQCEGDVE